jgi:hypothetical protein
MQQLKAYLIRSVRLQPQADGDDRRLTVPEAGRHVGADARLGPREEGGWPQRALPERRRWIEVVDDPVCGRLARVKLLKIRPDFAISCGGRAPPCRTPNVFDLR